MATTSHYTVESVIRGHHVYKHIWTPLSGEELALERELHNPHDRYATTIMKDGVIVGRVPRELSKLFWNFLTNGGVTTCEVTGPRKKGKGLEVPCAYKMSGSEDLVSKFQKSIEKKNHYFMQLYNNTPVRSELISFIFKTIILITIIQCY